MSLSDQLLLRRFLQGDRAAFDTLFRRYAPRVHATALRLTGRWEDAEEVLQEVFLTLMREARRIRRGAALPAWIYRTAVNEANTLLRRRRPTVSLSESTPHTAHVISVESVRLETEHRESVERETMLQRVETATPLLPERQRAVFVLRAFEGLTHAEIAEVLGINEGTSKSHYSLACRALRKHIAEFENAEETNTTQETSP